MPVKLCGNGKYRIGDGLCMYTSKEKAVSAYQAYLAKEKDNDMDLKEKKIAVLKSNASAKVKLAAVKRLDNDCNAKKNEALKAKINASNESDAVKTAALKRLG